jgi:regulator of protease activity HflC (stomatin/prohibitin superfamily)
MNMKRFLMAVPMFLMALALTGCGMIDQGNVGVRTQFGKIDNTPVTGFYTDIMSNVTEYTAKETTIELSNLQPQAGDRMTVQDFEATIFYQANANALPSFQARFAGMSARVTGDDGFYRPGYVMLNGMARSSVMGEVGLYAADQLNTKRAELEAGIKADLQKKIDLKAPGTFTITGVVIRNIVNDQTVQQSIRDSVTATNRLATATKLVQVKDQEAQANEKLASSFTPAFLQHEYNMALAACAESSKCTLIVDGSNSGKTLNLGKSQ